MSPDRTKPKNRSLASSCGLFGKAIRYGRGYKKALAHGLAVGANTHDLDAKSEMYYSARSSDASLGRPVRVPALRRADGFAFDPNPA